MTLPNLATSSLVEFELVVTAIDKPTERRRWNGDPMHSREASEALWRAVDVLRDHLRVEGFAIAHVGYGARALKEGEQ